MIKKIVLSLVVVLALIQLIRPEKNESNEHSNDISKGYSIPSSVSIKLQAACRDCHSNTTSYPWYTQIQPFGFWLNHHVDEGKHHLNFSTFTKLPIAVQNHKLEEIAETVKSHEMPLSSYTWFNLHEEAQLSNDDREMIITWAGRQMDSLKRVFPADSLVMKRRSRAK